MSVSNSQPEASTTHRACTTTAPTPVHQAVPGLASDNVQFREGSRKQTPTLTAPVPAPPATPESSTLALLLAELQKLSAKIDRLEADQRRTTTLHATQLKRLHAAVHDLGPNDKGKRSRSGASTPAPGDDANDRVLGTRAGVIPSAPDDDANSVASDEGELKAQRTLGSSARDGASRRSSQGRNTPMND